MARITVEDCLKHVKNRFELVVVASKRARQLSKNSVDPLVPAENDKSTVLALREIAAGHVVFPDENVHNHNVMPESYSHPSDHN